MSKKSKKKIPIKGAQKKSIVTKSTVPWFFYIFFGLLFSLLPFVYYRNGLDPAIHPRLLFLSVLLVPALIYAFWIKKKPVFDTSILFQPIFYVVTAYTVITAISMFFAINAREGLYDVNKSFSTLILFGLSSILFFNTKNWHSKLPILFIIPAITLIVVGFVDYYQNVFLATTSRGSQNLELIYEVRGNMAHKNQYSIALMLLLPFLGYGIYKSSKLLRWTYVFLSIIILAFVFILQTRSVWVGISISIILSLVLLITLAKKFNIGKKLKLSIALSMLAVTLIFGSVLYFSETTDRESIVYKLKNITNPSEGNNIHRVKIWDLTTSMIKDKPLQGVGAGNWKINSRYYFPGYKFSKVQLNWLRPHNDYLWVFSEKGVFGFLLYLGIFITAFVYLLKIILSNIETEKKVLALFLASGLSGFLIVSFFTFPLERMNHMIYIAVLLAALTTIYHQNFGNIQKKANIKLLSIISILILGFSVVYSSSVIEMETKVKQARIYHQMGKWAELNKLSKEIPKTFKTVDAEAMPIAWYAGLSYANLNSIKEANLAYLEAYEAHPTRIAILNNLGRTYFQMEEYENARLIFLEALDILPKYFESLVNLSSCYIQLGDYENAYETLNKIPRKKMNDPLKQNKRFVRRKLRELGKLADE